MAASFSPSAVANTLLRLAREAGVVLDPMKMQKLVYLAHGWHLGLNGTPLISEPIEAWDYGPVVPSLYRALKAYGPGAIRNPIQEFAPDGKGDFHLVQPTVDDSATEHLLARILEVYGKMSALQLSEMTHRPDTPWSQVRNAYPGVRGAVIPDSLMASYFRELADQNARRATAAS